MTDTDTQYALTLDQAEFHWGGRDAFGLTVPDFWIAKGERVLLLGESGSGKSTLLSLICGINAAQSGSICVDGTEMAQMRSSARDRFRAEKIGIVFQQFNLLPYASPMDNILLPLQFAPERRARVGDAQRVALALTDALGLARGAMTSSTASRHFNRASGSIFPHLARTGGIRPVDRRRSRCALSLIEREEISRGLVTKQSFRSIAQNLNRSPSTISREVRRNGGRQAYRAAPSDQRAWDCATRPKLCKLSFYDPLCQLIARKLRRKWSPQQIAGWLKRRYPDEEQNRVSHALLGRVLRSNVPRRERYIAASMSKPVGF